MTSKSAIIVVGSSQHGKSMLCNFLLLGERPTKQTIKYNVGVGTNSVTSEVQVEELDYTLQTQFSERENDLRPETHTVAIVDTPGVGDSRGDENEIILKLYRYLINVREENYTISSIVLACRYGTLLDDKFKNNLLFYRRMFSDVMQLNFNLVITNVSVEQGWIEEQELCGRSFGETIEGLKQYIVSCLGGTAKNNIMIHCINSFPSSQEDITLANSTRNVLISNAIRNGGIHIKEFKFVKPNSILEVQAQETLKLDYQMEGIMQGMELANGGENPTISRIVQESDSLTMEKEKQKRRRRLLDKKDCDKLIVIYTKNFNSQWGWYPGMWAPSVEIDEVLKFKIKNVVVSQGYWESTSESKYRLRGKIYNSLFKNLSTTITAYALYKEYYADDIKELKEEIEKYGKVIAAKQEELDKFLEEQAQTNDLISRYCKVIRDIEKQKEQLQCEFWTEEELRELLSSNGYTVLHDPTELGNLV